MAQSALKYDIEVKDGKLELPVPFPSGTQLTVFVIKQEDAFADLAQAAKSSTDFWDNPLDDEDWNNA